MRDVTARLEAEGKLRRAHDTLLSVSRLSAAGAMASTLAHELNQPLTASSNLLRSARRLLERGDGADKVPGLLAEAATEVLRAGSIIRRMREYTVNGELDPAPHRLADLAQTALTMVQRRTEARGVGVEWHLDPAVDKVMADPVQIEQVIANLLRNAVEAMDDKRDRRIIIETEAAGDQAALHVHDSGHGIAPEQMDRLFQPFATTKDSGTGLGLAICRTIVEAHGGQIYANNHPGGRGATFTITLPVARIARGRAARASA
jgi:C4-dicarboxylate-specific signal transduction histidine kinase